MPNPWKGALTRTGGRESMASPLKGASVRTGEVELGRTWPASMQAGHFLDRSAPSPAITGAGDSKQPSRTKPKGFALAALC